MQTGWYDQTKRWVRDLSSAGFRIILEFAVRRVACRTCGAVKRERLDFLADNPHFTRRFAFYIGRRCRQASIRDVAAELQLTWNTVKALEMQYMRAQIERAGTPGPTAIGIDEISIRKGHNYRIVVSDLMRKRAIPGSSPGTSLVRWRRSFQGQHGTVLRLAGTQEGQQNHACRDGHVEAVPQRRAGQGAASSDPVRQVPYHAASG